jgi:uncharacterized membrane protein
MRPFFKYLLICLGGNILFVALLYLVTSLAGNDTALGWVFFDLAAIGIAFVVQLIAGMGYLADKEKEDLGKAMLTSLGILALTVYFILRRI